MIGTSYTSGGISPGLGFPAGTDWAGEGHQRPCAECSFGLTNGWPPEGTITSGQKLFCFFFFPFHSVFSCQVTLKFWCWILLSWILSPNPLPIWLTHTFVLSLAEAVICRSGQWGRTWTRWRTSVLNYDVVDLRSVSPWHFDLELVLGLDRLKLSSVVQLS